VRGWLEGRHVVESVTVSQLLQRERQAGELRNPVLAVGQLAVPVAGEAKLADTQSILVETGVIRSWIRGNVVGPVKADRVSRIIEVLKVCIHCVARLLTFEVTNTGMFGLILLRVRFDRSQAKRPNTRSFWLKL